MARKLRKLRINEVSAVDVGAGSGVRIILCKRADGEIELPAPERETLTVDVTRKEAIAIAKRAVETGEPVPFTKSALFDAIQRTAEKQFPDGRTPEIRFAKFLETPEGRMLHEALKRAEPDPAPAPPTSSFEILAKGAADHAMKMGTTLPANSPYLPFLRKSDVIGQRDGADPDVVDEADKALKNVAQSLVDCGQFSSLEIALRYVRSSPKYRGIAGSAAGYRDASMRR